MNFLHKSLLLLNMRQRCQDDRQQDWQFLHQRDREWFLQQTDSSPWLLLQSWLKTFTATNPVALNRLVLLSSLVGLVLGFSLMAGLIQFQALQRINLWWWLLFAVWLPSLFWLVGLFFSRASDSGLWQQVLLSRLPSDWRKSLDKPLIHLSLVSLSQHFSLFFSFGLIISFSLYLLLTDLAFGWSSTLDISTENVYSLSQLLAWPWQSLWPQAVPSFQLVEESRFFHSQLPQGEAGNTYGQWWRFLLMNLLTYTLLPRLLSYVFYRWRLSQAHHRLFKQDACIAGWWQRLHFENVQQQAEQVTQASIPQTSNNQHASLQQDWPSIQQVNYWGKWPEAQLATLRASLPRHLQHMQWNSTDESNNQQNPVQGILLLCKGWEPPTGALIDYCHQLEKTQASIYLWPVPLAGMREDRIALLRRSWQMAMPEFPSNCQLLEPKTDA